jgi:hypothetical protein
MTENPLAIYLADHLAGSVHAIEVLKNIREVYDREPLGTFAADLLVEIEADRAVLQNLAERVGTGSSTIKELGAWTSEKISRMKLRHGSGNELCTFEALEFLEMGIHGKWALWRGLAGLVPSEPRLEGLDYGTLIARAENQHDRVERWRLDIARLALLPQYASTSAVSETETL